MSAYPKSSASSKIQAQPEPLFDLMRSDIRQCVGQYLSEMMEVELAQCLGRAPYSDPHLKPDN